MPFTKRQQLDIAIEALRHIARFNDTEANEWLRKTGSYEAFAEPSSVAMAREVLRVITINKRTK